MDKQFFENIYGQETVCAILSNQIKHNKVSHAYLFTGPKGSGKLQVAKEFSKRLIGGKNADAIDKEIHPDVKVLSPDGVNAYLIAQIKTIVKEAFLAPIQGNKKVYIVQSAELLGSSAANAFLKTLEEPPKDVVFILTANDKNNVLQTIVSRCQHLPFKSNPVKHTIELITKETEADEEQAKKALFVYGGDIQKSVNFCNKQSLQDYYYDISNIASDINSLNEWELIKASQYLSEKQDEIVDEYKLELDDKLKESSDILESSTIKLMEDQNKRAVLAMEKELMYFVCSCIKLYYRELLVKNVDIEKQINRINVISKMEEDLAYNINSNLFFDVLLLNLKRI